MKKDELLNRIAEKLGYSDRDDLYVLLDDEGHEVYDTYLSTRINLDTLNEIKALDPHIEKVLIHVDGKVQIFTGFKG